MSTIDFKPAVMRYLARIQSNTEQGSEANYMLSDLIDDLLSNGVTITREVSETVNLLPVFNAETDGDYSQWLATNNID